MRSRNIAWGYALLTIYLLIVLFPILDLVALSFKNYAGIVSNPVSLPHVWRWSNYVTAWTEGDLGRFLINTAFVAVFSTFLTILCGSMAAYVLARFEFRGNQLIYLVFVAGLALPVLMIAAPLFVLIERLHLYNNPLALVFVYSSGGLGFTVFLLVNFIRAVPKDLEEAAYIDGAGPLLTFTMIVLPLVRPSIATVSVFNIVNAWNGFFFPLIFLQDQSKMTVAVGIMSFVGEYGTQWNLLLPALVIVMVPTILVFIVASKQFIRNMTTGAIKF